MIPVTDHPLCFSAYGECVSASTVSHSYCWLSPVCFCCIFVPSVSHSRCWSSPECFCSQLVLAQAPGYATASILIVAIYWLKQAAGYPLEASCQCSLGPWCGDHAMLDAQVWQAARLIVGMFIFFNWFVICSVLDTRGIFQQPHSLVLIPLDPLAFSGLPGLPSRIFVCTVYSTMV